MTIATSGGGKGISMNGEPTEGTTATMNEDGIPVAQGTPIGTTTPKPVGSGTGPGMTMNNAANFTTTTTTMGDGTPVPNIPMHEQQKIGSKCCGCCCDFRRAVIILDVILMILSIMSLLSIALGPIVADLYRAQGIDDDEVLEELEDNVLVTQIINGIGLICMAVPVYGASIYSIPLIGYGIVWLVSSFVAGIVVSVIYINKANDVPGAEDIGMPFMNWVGSAIITAFCIYPHVGLMSEIQSGIMSQATYPREEFSCCCTGGR